MARATNHSRLGGPVHGSSSHLPHDAELVCRRSTPGCVFQPGSYLGTKKLCSGVCVAMVPLGWQHGPAVRLGLLPFQLRPSIARMYFTFGLPGAARCPTALLAAAQLAGWQAMAVLAAGALWVATALHSQACRLVDGGKATCSSAVVHLCVHPCAPAYASISVDGHYVGHPSSSTWAASFRPAVILV